MSNESELVEHETHCPACGHAISPSDTAGSNASLLQCPQCGEQFFATETDEIDSSFDDDEAARQELEDRQTSAQTDDASPDLSTLNERRIRAVVIERRAVYRSRSWAIVLAGVCVVGAGQMVLLIVRAVSDGAVTGRTIGFMVATPVALVLTVYFARKAVEFGRRAAQVRTPDPQTAPDFSTLSDGSQTVRNLQDMADGGMTKSQ